MGEFQPLQSTYYRFFRDAGTAMAIADKNGVLVASNGRFNELIQSLSVNPMDIGSDTARLGASFDFLPIHDAVRFSNLLSRIANGETVRMDFKAPYHDRESQVHWFKIHAWKMSADPRVDLSGRGPFIGFILSDETVEKEAEERLQEDMRIAEKAMEAKSRFLATMSHEIRTPIQTIIGMTELLEDTALTREQAGYAQQVKFSAEVLLSLVNDILDYSKIEAGKVELERVPFFPGETVEQIAKMLSLEAGEKGLNLIVDIHQEARRRVLGDPGRFRQIVINLIKNAVKFTPQGEITVTLSLSPGADFIDPRLTATVADTGIGVAEDVRERLFTTFMQADSSHSRRFGGTGLGLAISRNLVELMGGTIEMLPNEGGGSIFRFTIPVKEETEPPPGFIIPPETVPLRVEAAKPEAAEKPAARGDAGVKAVENAGVLIVEDHPVNQQLFVMIMNKLGITTFAADDGLEALEAAAAHPVDLIFMDIQMPRMNGYEAARELRRRGFSRPIVALTANVLDDERQRCLEAGFDDILFKPFKRPGIEAVYHKWIGKTGGAFFGGGVRAVFGTAPEAVPEPPSAPAESALLGAPPVEAAGKTAGKEPPVIFSKEDLLDTFMNNEESAKSLLFRFLQRSAEQLESLPGLLGEENWEEAHRIAHTIKGSAMTLSGMDLGAAAARLEKAYKKQNREEIAAALPPVMEAFRRFKTAAEEYILP
ncbi:MAG: response regulator [Treponema sp.]|jgi:signal transduction histidine kinase/CheY-like chemotaxis protein|nr:response regulator [Treponema sp.]